MTRFISSLKNAINGLRYAISQEKNFQIEFVFAVVVISMIAFFRISGMDAAILVILVSWVMAMELLNTVVEKIIDMLKPRIHPYARLAKDVTAGAVLISAIASVIAGIIIFLPYFKPFFN